MPYSWGRKYWRKNLPNDEVNLKQVSMLSGPAAVAQLVKNRTTAHKSGGSNPVAIKRNYKMAVE